MTLKHTPLDALHRELGARMVPFAGYEMPVQYETGIIAEHQHARSKASLFDVSHMGQLVLEGAGVSETLETLVPADILGLALHRQCYTLLTNEAGGVRDDLIVTRWGDDRLFLVVNAACKAADQAHIEAALAAGQSLREQVDQGLLALQGPGARRALGSLVPDAAALTFLQGGEFRIGDIDVYITCSGYTGEDGFELSVSGAQAEALARRILALPEVAPAGLGARDSLRLEAGLCLYGQDLSPDISPIEAGLAWSIGKARRPGGERAGGYPGAGRVAAELADGPVRRRVGLRVDGRRPVRQGHAVRSEAGELVGTVTSGGFGVTLGAPLAMAYVAAEHAPVGERLLVDVRGKDIVVEVTRLPFVKQRYYRG